MCIVHRVHVSPYFHRVLIVCQPFIWSNLEVGEGEIGLNMLYASVQRMKQTRALNELPLNIPKVFMENLMKFPELTTSQIYKVTYTIIFSLKHHHPGTIVES
jgi:hypothetical protein